MAAPAAVSYFSYGFRDAKGQTRRLRILIGATTDPLMEAAADGLVAKFQAVSNAHVYESSRSAAPDRTYGTAANYQDVADKAQLTFVDVQGSLHRYEVPAPKLAEFLADQETVDQAETNMAALITAIQTNGYGRPNDASPLTYIGGLRKRGPMSRRFNILVKNPTETGPGE